MVRCQGLEVDLESVRCQRVLPDWGKPFTSVEKDLDFPGVMGMVGSRHVTTEGDLLKDKDIVLLALWKRQGVLTSLQIDMFVSQSFQFTFRVLFSMRC